MAHDPRVERLEPKVLENRRQMDLAIEILEKFAAAAHMDAQVREEVEDLINEMQYGD